MHATGTPGQAPIGCGSQLLGARYQQSPSQKTPWESTQPCWEVQHIGAIFFILIDGLVERANRVPNAEKPEPQAIGARHQQAARRKVLWESALATCGVAQRRCQSPRRAWWGWWARVKVQGSWQTRHGF